MIKLLTYFYFLVFLIPSIPIKADQYNNNPFERITDKDGLSQNTILSILRDRKGFLWIGTYEGLNRYDGYNFKIFRSNSNEPGNLNSNRIGVIFEDQSGEIWLGSDGGGLNKLIRETETFTHYTHDPGDSNSISGNRVNCIYEDRLGVFWIGTDNGGLNRFNREKNIFTGYKNDPEDPHSLSNNSITSIYEDRDSNLWISTYNGLNLFDRAQNQFIRYLYQPVNTQNYKMNSLSFLLEDRFGIFWIGTYDDGLYQFNRQTGQIQKFIHDHQNTRSVSSNWITSIHEDRHGQLWIGTRNGLDLFNRKKNEFTHHINNQNDPSTIGGNIINVIHEDPPHLGDILWIGGEGTGLNKLRLDRKPFRLFRRNESIPNTLSSNFIMSIYEDPKEDGSLLWIGTKGGGLNRFNRKNGQFFHYKHDPDNTNSLGDNDVRTICSDQYGVLWMGTEEGITTFDPETDRFHQYEVNPYDSTKLRSYAVFTLFEDKGGTIWVGGWDLGLAKYNRRENIFSTYFPDHDDPFSINSQIIWFVYEDPEEAGQILWMGTHDGGLNRFDRITEKFTHYTHDPDDSNSIIHNTVLSIHKAEESNCLWIATCGGLDKFNKTTGIFTHYTEKDGLPSNSIQSILFDNQGNIWMGTTRGLTKFNVQKKIFRSYRPSDGLQSNDFSVNACFKSITGEMIFGGSNGFNIFYPDSIKENKNIPNVVITDLSIFNQSVPVSADKSTPLQKSITETQEIRLSYNQHVISFGFAALDFAFPQENQYAYKMEGFEKAWNYADASKRFATYTNLDPGEFFFKVKASNNDGVWNEKGISLKVIISPPLWKTWWFQTLTIILTILLVVAIYKIRIYSIGKQNRELEEINEKLNKEILDRKRAEKQVSDQLKEKQILLKEVYHRVKNNLQVICSLLRLESKQINRNNFMRIFQETENRIRSMALVHEKLYESQTLAEINIKGYIQDLIQNLCSFYESFIQTIQVDVQEENINIITDQAVPFGLVINELVSNAIQHAFPNISREKAKIYISFKEISRKNFQLIVKDNGIGLPESIDLNQKNTLGLKLVRILTEEQLDGSVQIIRNQGTQFIIEFPKLSLTSKKNQK